MKRKYEIKVIAKCETSEVVLYKQIGVELTANNKENAIFKATKFYCDTSNLKFQLSCILDINERDIIDAEVVEVSHCNII